MKTWFDGWIGEFYSLLKEGGWMPYKTYFPWFDGKDIKKQRLETALENKKVKFRLVVKTDGKSIDLLESLPDYQRKKFIEELLAFGSETGELFDLQLDADSLLAWLKKNYPFENQPHGIESTSDSSPSTVPQGLTIPTGHEYEPPLLKIAVECWEALYEDAGPDGKKIRKPQIEKWLQENHAELSANSRKTIVTVVNPFKTGGATPSE